MKFMKLGSKPDAFQTDGNTIRHVVSEPSTDIVITVGDTKFHLHKFPLLSKSNRLQRLVSESGEEDDGGDCCSVVRLVDFPGGAKAFGICVKFCYGVTVTLNAYNVVSARCAAEFLEMSEDMERGNLIYKIEVFLSSSIFRSWKDSIIVLQTASSVLPWSDDLKIVGRCVDSIASRACVDPSGVHWSYTCNRKLEEERREIQTSMKFSDRSTVSVPKDWWIEDIAVLEIDLYRRVMAELKSRGKMDDYVIVEALRNYAARWLPDSAAFSSSSPSELNRNRAVVESVIFLLPAAGAFVGHCSFLLKLLSASVLLGVSESAVEDLVKRIGVKLDDASVGDLLIPANSDSALHDVEIVKRVLEQFAVHERGAGEFRPRLKNSGGGGGDGDEFVVLERGAWLKVGKLIDGYLVEIARDPNLTVPSFVDLAQTIPASARSVHDQLYRAIDIYLQEHPRIAKGERKIICGMIDVKKLTIDASMHAAQNERLPLRLVVQVLFFEQIRAAAAAVTAGKRPTPRDALRSTTNTEEDSDAAVESCRSLRRQAIGSANSRSRNGGAAHLLQSRSKRIFEKLWIVGKTNGEVRSSETSAESQSPTSTMVPVEIKSSSSSSRNRRHSVS